MGKTIVLIPVLAAAVLMMGSVPFSGLSEKGADPFDLAFGATPAPAASAPVAPAAPAGPKAQVVYKSNFAKEGGKEWWPRWTDKTPVGARPFLGEFGIEPATFTLRNLPAHKYIRINMTLLMLRPMDGSSITWGPDPWEMRVLGGGPTLLYTTFDNCCFFYDNNEQAFPDNFPWALHRGWTGAAEKQTLGYPYTPNDPRDTSSVYKMTLVFPHEDKDLRLLLRALWSEQRKERGESWGMESFEVETLDGPLPLSDDELEDAWEALDSEDSVAAFPALWQLVGAGDKAVEFIRGRVGKPAPVRVKPAKPQPPEPDDELGRLLKALDDPSYQVREQATQRLAEIGLPMLDRLKKVVETVTSPEVRVRLRQVIRQLEEKQAAATRVVEGDRRWPLPPQNYLPQRVARVLETIGGPLALHELTELAGGKDEKLAVYAASSRQRLAEGMLEHLLDQAETAGRAGDGAAAEALCDQALQLAKANLPEDAGRVAAAREDGARRAKARAEPLKVAEAARREAMRQRVAVGDDPAGAVDLADDPKDRVTLALAAKPLEDLSLEELATLRAFYLKEAKSPDGAILPGMVARALAASRPGDQPTDKAFEPTDGVDRGVLAPWLIEQARRGRWAELLPLFDVPAIAPDFNAIPQGRWEREWRGLKGGGNVPALYLPAQLTGSYQLRLTMIPVTVSTVSLWVPVGDKHVRIDISGNGDTAIQATADKGGWAVGKWTEGDLRYGHQFRADVTVRQAADGSVTVGLALDGRTVAEWKGKTADIRPLDAGAALKGGPSIQFQGHWVVLMQAAVRLLDGSLKLEPVKQPDAAVPPDGDGEPPVRIQLRIGVERT